VIRAELASGEILTFEDDTPDDVVRSSVMRHIRAQKAMAMLVSAIDRNTQALKDMTEAYRAPREIVVKRDLSGDKVLGAESHIKDDKETRH
jgi:16S rRNA C1402 (ribose-2'-O) methylase RsmI